jgi:hypothetical protein
VIVCHFNHVLEAGSRDLATALFDNDCVALLLVNGAVLVEADDVVLLKVKAGDSDGLRLDLGVGLDYTKLEDVVCIDACGVGCRDCCVCIRCGGFGQRSGKVVVVVVVVPTVV